MRVLFTFAGNRGHLDPLLPIARAVASRGHTVAFCGRPWMVPKVESLGFVCFPGGTDDGLIPERVPLRPVERDDTAWGVRKPRLRAVDLLALGEAWRPDVIVWEETDFAAGVIAERLGLPHASVIVTASGSFLRPELVRLAVDELRAEHGLTADPDLATLSRHLVLAPFPPCFRDPAYPLPATATAIRPAVLEP